MEKPQMMKKEGYMKAHQTLKMQERTADSSQAWERSVLQPFS